MTTLPQPLVFGEADAPQPAISNLSVEQTHIHTIASMYLSFSFDVASPSHSTAVLNFPLPDDGVVCDFSCGGNKAVAVDQSKAAAAAHVEEERGNKVSVGKVSKESSARVFSTRLSGLSSTPVSVRIGVKVGSVSGSTFHYPLTLRDIGISVNNLSTTPPTVREVADLANGLTLFSPVPPYTGLSDCALARAEDQIFFAGHVNTSVAGFPTLANPTSASSVNGRIALVLDSSRSSFFTQTALATLIFSIPGSPRFFIYGLSRRMQCFTPSRGLGFDKKEAVECVRSIVYEGGTDMRLLGKIFKQARRDRCTAAIFHSDGVSNFPDEVPCFSDPDGDEAGLLPLPFFVIPPVHAPAQDRTMLTFIAVQTGGSVCSKAPELMERLLGGTSVKMQRWTIEMAEDSDVTPTDLFEDTRVSTSPDFRLTGLNTAVDSDGVFHFAGVFPSALRDQIFSFRFLFEDGNHTTTEVTVPVPSLLETGSFEARGVHVHAVQHMIKTLETAVHDRAQVRHETVKLATECGFATDDVSLLVLTSAQQHADHGIAPPADSSLYSAWRQEMAARAAHAEEAEEGLRSKKRAKLEQVCELTKRLSGFGTRDCGASNGHSLRGFAPNAASSAWSTLETVGISSGYPPGMGVDEDEEEEEEQYRTVMYRSLSSAVPAKPPSSLAAPSSSPSPVFVKPFSSSSSSAPIKIAALKDHVETVDEQTLQRFADSSISDVDKLRAAGNFLDKLPSAQTELASTHLLLASAMFERGVSPAICADVAFNALEVASLSTVALRSVGHHLLAMGCFDAALQVFEVVRERAAPTQPHSLIDLALARILYARSIDDDEKREFAFQLVKDACADLARVVCGLEWRASFSEIEFPVLQLLSWASAWAEWKFEGRSAWPEELLPDKQGRDLRVDFKFGVFVWAGWDTDHTDIDLHVEEPDGFQVSYQQTRSVSGGCLSRDFTDGFGPEVYAIKTPPAGKFEVQVKFFSNNAATNETGATSVILFAVEHMGDFGTREKVHLAVKRLNVHKQMHSVFTLHADALPIA